MKAHLIFGALAAATLALACGPKAPDGSDESGESGEGTSNGSGETAASTTDATTSGASTTDASTTDVSTSDGSTSGNSFVMGDVFGEAMCDIWDPNDCGESEKCMPYAMMGDTWDALKCSPLAENPKVLGDECNAIDGTYGGVDDCGKGLYCYYVDMETNVGTCIEFCTGSPVAPMCGPDAICTIVNDGVLVLCRPECDPTIQDCEPANSGCYQATGTGSFTCIIDKSGPTGQYGDTCELISSCDPGFACVEQNGVPGCTTGACCTPFCDINQPNNCPGAAQGQTCEPYYAQPDPGYEHVGICVLPTP